MQATDKDNPLRVALDLDDAMYGRLISEVQSYDLMDNTKYKRLNRLLEMMNETFGFNEDLMMLRKNNQTITKGGQIIDIKPSNNRPMFDQTLKSNEDI